MEITAPGMKRSKGMHISRHTAEPASKSTASRQNHTTPQHTSLIHFSKSRRFVRVCGRYSASVPIQTGDICHRRTAGARRAACFGHLSATSNNAAEAAPRPENVPRRYALGWPAGGRRRRCSRQSTTDTGQTGRKIKRGSIDRRLKETVSHVGRTETAGRGVFRGMRRRQTARPLDGLQKRRPPTETESGSSE